MRPGRRAHFPSWLRMIGRPFARGSRLLPARPLMCTWSRNSYGTCGRTHNASQARPLGRSWALPLVRSLFRRRDPLNPRGSNASWTRRASNLCTLEYIASREWQASYLLVPGDHSPHRGPIGDRPNFHIASERGIPRDGGRNVGWVATRDHRRVSQSRGTSARAF